MGKEAPASNDMPSGMRHAPGAGTTARSAKAPSGTEARTRSPAAKPSTPAPTARTTPASSAPGTNGKGGFTWYCPRTMRRSKKLQPAARTSTARVPGASSGSGASRTRRSAGSIQRSTTIARMRYSIADDAGPTQPARKERPHARGRPARQRRHAAPARERAREGVGDAARARRVVGPPPPYARLPPLHPRGHEHRRGPAGWRVVPLRLTARFRELLVELKDGAPA